MLRPCRGAVGPLHLMGEVTYGLPVDVSCGFCLPNGRNNGSMASAQKIFRKRCNRSAHTCIVTGGASPRLFCTLSTRANSAHRKIRRIEVIAPFSLSCMEIRTKTRSTVFCRNRRDTLRTNPLPIFFALMQVWRCAVARNFHATHRAGSAAARFARAA